MNDDRAQVLSRIRAALATAHLPAARATIPPRAAKEPGDPAGMLKRFQRELEPLGGSSHLARTPSDAISVVLNLLEAAGGSELITWSDKELPLRGLGEALHARGYTRLMVDLSADAAARRARLLELERATAGITGALAGLAETGSLALLSGPTRPRLASLLPPTHIALLPTARLYPTMSAFFAAHPALTRDASNLVLVTGPSRTADIELTLTRGVHGPKFLHVVLLDWEV